jgi:uncharacterized protein (TIGR02646 family)
MRPVKRGPSPQTGDFEAYRDALPFLGSRLGCYCSYCERRVATQLAVEHLQPKDGPHGRPELEGRWENYLLACVNCNSTKLCKRVDFRDLLFPDRDNTFAALTYQADGKIEPAPGLSDSVRSMARATLALTGLDKRISDARDENGRLIAIDRVAQRMEAWLVAEEARIDVNAAPGNDAVRRGAIRTAQGYGFFSIWMTVFANDPDMRNRLIDAFDGTRASGCFDPVTTLPVSPAPNPDALADGSKV